MPRTRVVAGGQAGEEQTLRGERRAAAAVAVDDHLAAGLETEARTQLRVAEREQVLERHVARPGDVPLARIAGRAPGAVVLRGGTHDDQDDLIEARGQLLELDLAHRASSPGAEPLRVGRRRVVAPGGLAERVTARPPSTPRSARRAARGAEISGRAGGAGDATHLRGAGAGEAADECRVRFERELLDAGQLAEVGREREVLVDHPAAFVEPKADDGAILEREGERDRAEPVGEVGGEAPLGRRDRESS